jgi:lipopolysaccharide transport system ATP-binding protein
MAATAVTVAPPSTGLPPMAVRSCDLEEQDGPTAMVDRGWRIGICGTFDIANYGDLLFPLIAEAELQKRLGPIRLDRFSYHQRSASDWPYAVHSLTDLAAMVGDLDGMLIGGGDLIRFDENIAPGYRPPTSEIHHPTGYWLAPMLIGLQAGCPVVWNAPGVIGDTPTWAEPLLRLVTSSSDYVSVRDEVSRRALSRGTGEVGIELVPDTAFGVAHLVDLDRPSTEFVRLCESFGLTDPYVVVQATTGLESFTRLLQGHQNVLQGHQVVILPIGPILGDDVAILGEDVPRGIRLATWPDPLVIAELIGHAAAAVGTSLHLAITALAFGVPVFRPAGAIDGKYAVLQSFDGVATFDNATEMDPHWFTERLGKSSPSPAVIETIDKSSKHWDRIASIIRAGNERPARLLLSRFWQSVPGSLEAWATRDATMLAERDAAKRERDAAIVERDAAKGERDAAIVERDAVIAEVDGVIAERDAATNECHRVAGERDAVITDRDEVVTQLSAIRHSNSWRITAPLRALRDRLRRNSKVKEDKK